MNNYLLIILFLIFLSIGLLIWKFINKKKLKQKIICDVNIWYRIGEGKIEPSSFKDYCLVASQQNIREIGSSTELIYNPDKVKEAILAIDKYACEIILLDPFDDFIKTHVDPSYSTNYMEYYKIVFQTMLDWAKGEIEFDLDTEEKREEFKNKILAHDASMDAYSNSVNGLLPSLRARKKAEFKKNPEKEEDILMASMVDLVFGIISDRLKIQKEELSLPTDQLELLIRSWTKLHRNIIMQPQGKMQPNDPDDMPYLAYVGKDDLFWSGDYKFLNKILGQPKDLEVEKYLFDKDRNLIKSS